MSLQNSSYPENISVKRIHLSRVTVKLDFDPVVVSIEQPLPGHWYAAAVLKEDTDQIKQKGLFKPCFSKLFSSLRLNIVRHATTLLQNSETLQNVSSFQIYRFFTNRNGWTSTIQIRNCSVSSNCPLILKSRSMGVPSTTESRTINCSDVEDCSLSIIPAIQDWNYISVENYKQENSGFNLWINTTECNDSMQDTEFKNSNPTSNYNWTDNLPGTICWPPIPFVRISPPMEITFEYNRLVPSKGSFAYNISNTKFTLTNFQVYSSVDIGQAVVVELAVISENYSRSNVQVHVCLSYGIRPNSWDVNCISGRPMTTHIGNPDASQLFIPFPEAGTWYIRLHTSCYNRSSFRFHAFTCDGPETAIWFRVLSTPCVSQLCGRYGHCEQHNSGGLVFSTCKCLAGWKGWGCTDNSTAKSDSRLKVEVTLLVLSNIFFLPAIILSAYRKYFGESWVYFAAMIVSGLYHGCDAEVFSYCLVRKDVLQFSDTFLAILAIWVTLIVMSEFSRSFQTCVQIVGAVFIGCIVRYDPDGLLVFVLPFSLGLAILLTSWVIQCYKKSVLFYPPAKIWLISLAPGTALALSGLAVFAFLETKDNYPLAHSAWHILISLSIVFLLPKQKTSSERPEELESSEPLASI